MMREDIMRILEEELDNPCNYCFNVSRDGECMIDPFTRCKRGGDDFMMIQNNSKYSIQGLIEKLQENKKQKQTIRENIKETINETGYISESEILLISVDDYEIDIHVNITDEPLYLAQLMLFMNSLQIPPELVTLEVDGEDIVISILLEEDE